MKVLKFGGTSVGSVNSILSVKKIVEAIEEPVIVVVSALGGITDKLLATSTMASKGDLAYEKELSEIIARHLDVIEGVIEDKEVRMDVQKKVMALLDELSNIFKGVYLINDLSAKTSDTIVSYGERLSSLIVSNVIKDAKLFDSRKYIKTVKQYRGFRLDQQAHKRDLLAAAQGFLGARIHLFQHGNRRGYEPRTRGIGLYRLHLGDRLRR